MRHTYGQNADFYNLLNKLADIWKQTEQWHGDAFTQQKV